MWAALLGVHAFRRKIAVNVSATLSQAEPLLTVEQAAERLNCSTYTVRRLISRGQLRAVRAGRLIRIKPRDLERALRPVTSLGGDAA